MERPRGKNRASFAIGSTRTLRRADTSPEFTTPLEIKPPVKVEEHKRTWSSINFEEFSGEEIISQNDNINIQITENSNNENIKTIIIKSKENFEQKEQDKLLRQKKVDPIFSLLPINETQNNGVKRMKHLNAHLFTKTVR